ncbi:hypothetical protein AHF37_11448 [Paragonimus kellicotti]|nr:hypothetical protein AHF37_11448 [Paragonimus kellicotti]
MLSTNFRYLYFRLGPFDSRVRCWITLTLCRTSRLL